jgi:hypothetical protein
MIPGATGKTKGVTFSCNPWFAGSSDGLVGLQEFVYSVIVYWAMSSSCVHHTYKKDLSALGVGLCGLPKLLNKPMYIGVSV